MAILDFLKNKEEKEAQKKTAAKKPVKASVAKKVEVTDASAPAVAKPVNTGKTGFSYTVIKEPHISEKATILAESNKYTFKVYPNTNKPEIKKAVEGIYGVDVIGVTVMKSPKKKRRLGKTQGFKKAFEKAVVTIKAGQKIEIF